MTGVEVLVALAIAIGLVGVIVPVLPGSLLVLAAILVWAWDLGSATAWTVFGIAAGVHRAGRRREVRRPGPPPEEQRRPRLHARCSVACSASSASS